MPNDKFYQGWRSETLAEYILSNFAFTVPVPVKYDVGVDYFCTLFKIDEQSLLPDSTFTIQIKSKGKPTYLSKFCIDYLAGLEAPYFLGIVDKKQNTIDIYSCQQLLCLLLKFGSLKGTVEKFKLLLKPVKNYSKKTFKAI